MLYIGIVVILVGIGIIIYSNCKYNKDLTVRAENLSVQEFVEISNVLFK